MEDIFYNRFADKNYTFKGLLPHLNQDQKLQFITFHLGDSLPQAKIAKLIELKEQFLKAHPKPWSESDKEQYSQLISPCISQLLDNGHGSCLFRRPEIRKIVAHSLHHLDGKCYELLAAVIMPNHVHMLIVTHPNATLANILHSLKSFTSHKINSITGNSGSIWQRDYYDRIIRTPKHLNNCLDYIRANPRHLSPNEFYLYINPSWD